MEAPAHIEGGHRILHIQGALGRILGLGDILDLGILLQLKSPSSRVGQATFWLLLEALRQRRDRPVEDPLKELLVGSKVLGICLFSFKQLETTRLTCSGASSETAEF